MRAQFLHCRQHIVSFQRNDSGIVLKFSPHFLNERKCALMNRKYCQPFKNN